MNETPQRVALPGLNPDRFRHPFDRQATARLRRVPLLESVVRQGSSLMEEAIFLENISSSILVGPNQMSSLYQLLAEACEILDIKDIPQLYVKQQPVPNAYTMAFQGKKPFIVIHTSLLELMTPVEIQAVIAHELGHIKCEHGVWLSVANLLAFGLATFGWIPGQLLADNLSSTILPWRRAAEFTCDRAALLVVQDTDVVITTMLKLVGGVSTAALGSVSAEEFLKQAEQFKNASTQSRYGRFFSEQLQESRSHPLPVIRAQEITSWAKSLEYNSLVQRGTVLQEK